MAPRLRLRAKLVLLVVAPLVALLAVGGSAILGASRSGSQLHQLQDVELRLYKAVVDIRYLDEVLTHSATRYIQSRGDASWWDRYEAHVPKLDAALATARELADVEDLAFLDAVDSANQRLIDLESEIHNLTKVGLYDEANAVLSGQYEAQKSIYSAGVEEFFNASVRRIDGAIRDEQVRATHFRQLVAALTVVGLAVVAWAVVVARSLSRTVERVTANAREAAEIDLAAIVAARQRGAATADSGYSGSRPDHGDLLTGSEALTRGDELAGLDEAIALLRAKAVGVASDQAALRLGVSDLVAKLGRRDHTLLNRTIGVLNRLERNGTDSASAADLAQLRRLVGRMQRNAASLLIYAGAGQAGTRREPTTPAAIVAAALAAIERWERIDVVELAAAGIAAGAVADLAHLVAEVLEDATDGAPSEANARLVVTGRHLGDRYVLSITGAGPEIRAAGPTLPGALAPDDHRRGVSHLLSLRAGVVSRLAARHGISVEVEVGPDGRATAQITVPGPLLTDPDPDPGPGPAASQPARLPSVPEAPAGARHGPVAAAT